MRYLLIGLIGMVVIAGAVAALVGIYLLESEWTTKPVRGSSATTSALITRMPEFLSGDREGLVLISPDDKCVYISIGSFRREFYLDRIKLFNPSQSSTTHLTACTRVMPRDSDRR